MSCSWQPSSSVRLLKQGSDPEASPIWIFPVFSGTTACFDSMLNSLEGYRRTVYGVMDPYLTGNNESLTSGFDEWIGLYVAAMKTKQASGPYTLMGYSQGIHWCFAVSEHLRKLGDATDAIVSLDPNFPAWCNADRCVAWLGPPASKQTGIPMCILRLVMGSMMGKMVKSAKWQTQAIRDRTVHGSIAKGTTDPGLYAGFFLELEMDAGVEFGATEKANQAIAKAVRATPDHSLLRF